MFLINPKQSRQPKVAYSEGVELSVNGDGLILMTPMGKINRLKAVRTEKKINSQYALALYISVDRRQDICAEVYLIAREGQAVCDAQFLSLRKGVDHLKDRGDAGPSFIKLEMESLQIVVLSDPSFVNVLGNISIWWHHIYGGWYAARKRCAVYCLHIQPHVLIHNDH